MSRYFFCKCSDGEYVVADLLDCEAPILWAFLQGRRRGLAVCGVRVIPEAEADFRLRNMPLGVRPEAAYLHAEINSLRDDYQAFRNGANQDREGFVAEYPRVAVPFLRLMLDSEKKENERFRVEATRDLIGIGSGVYDADLYSDEFQRFTTQSHYPRKKTKKEGDGEHVCRHSSLIVTGHSTWLEGEIQKRKEAEQVLFDRIEMLVRERYEETMPEGEWWDITKTGVEETLAAETETSEMPAKEMLDILNRFPYSWKPPYNSQGENRNSKEAFHTMHLAELFNRPGVLDNPKLADEWYAEIYVKEVHFSGIVKLYQVGYLDLKFFVEYAFCTNGGEVHYIPDGNRVLLENLREEIDFLRRSCTSQAGISGMKTAFRLSRVFLEIKKTKKGDEVCGSNTQSPTPFTESFPVPTPEPVEVKDALKRKKQSKKQLPHEEPDIMEKLLSMVSFSEGDNKWIKAGEAAKRTGITSEWLRRRRVPESHVEKSGVVYGIDENWRFYAKPGKDYYYYSETIKPESRKQRSFCAKVCAVKTHEKNN